MPRILIAEDDLTSCRLLEAMLVKWGYQVEITRDGEQAWAALQQPDAPKIAILDWMMPGMAGTEVCQKVRALPTTVPPYLILLTAMNEKRNIVEGLRAGANDYVTKPFDSAELKARVEVGRLVLELYSTLANKVSELQEALDHVKTLQGILPICMHCHKIRTDSESWQRIDTYITQHTDVNFSHGLCPDCLEKYYPEDDSEEES